jgi:hypothetical protein
MLSIIGAALILCAIADVLQTLFGLFGAGFSSDAAARRAWRALKMVSRGPRLLQFAGPLILFGVIVVWVVTLVLGWALIYWDAMPHGFLHAHPGDGMPRFLDALYLSTITLSTLGYGDIVPTAGGLRLAAALQSLTGFSMITACVTWILSIYPVLTRRRALAYEIALLADAAKRWDMHLGKLGDHIEGVLHDLTRALSSVHSDLMQFPHTYYFHSRPERFELALTLPRLSEVARATSDSSDPGLRFQSELLDAAIRDLGRTIAKQVGGDADADLPDVLRRYAQDHGAEIRRTP